jgi:Fur family transcriptional regulator, ferric uptake regulator
VGYLTRQKLILGELFNSALRPLTAQEVCRQAKRRLPSLGLATVYRALRQFVSEGAIRVVQIPGVPPHYESAARNHHHFFLCQGCKQLFDLVGCVRGLTTLVPDGFRVRHHEIVLYGQCADCVARLGARGNA